jgi:hypothetical protein
MRRRVCGHGLLLDGDMSAPAGWWLVELSRTPRPSFLFSEVNIGHESLSSTWSMSLAWPVVIPIPRSRSLKVVPRLWWHRMRQSSIYRTGSRCLQTGSNRKTPGIITSQHEAHTSSLRLCLAKMSKLHLHSAFCILKVQWWK